MSPRSSGVVASECARHTRRDHGGGLVRRTVWHLDRCRSRQMSRGPFVSYAQNQEDVVLARALHPDDRGGFWVDVGAGDPVLDSVTAAFAERGWRGAVSYTHLTLPTIY